MIGPRPPLPSDVTRIEVPSLRTREFHCIPDEAVSLVPQRESSAEKMQLVARTNIRESARELTQRSSNANL